MPLTERTYMSASDAIRTSRVHVRSARHPPFPGGGRVEADAAPTDLADVSIVENGKLTFSFGEAAAAQCPVRC
jgi:hypothetical protein